LQSNPVRDASFLRAEYAVEKKVVAGVSSS
jgi:hypothetical protein